MNGQMQARYGNAMVPVVLMIAVAVAAGVVLFGGIGITGKAKPQSKIHGTFTVTQQAGFQPAGSCGTDAVKDGTPVTVSDDTGKAIGSGHLFDGTGIKVKGDAAKASQCRFSFVVLRLPAVETYQVRVGANPPQSVTRRDLISNHWRLDLAA